MKYIMGKRRFIIIRFFLILLTVEVFVHAEDSSSAFQPGKLPAPQWTWVSRRSAVTIPVTEEEMKKQAQDLVDAGVNMVNAEYPAPGILDFERREAIRTVKKYVDIMHGAGIKVIAHHMSLSLGGSQAQGPPARYSELLQINPQGRPAFGGSYWWLCPNNPIVRQAHKDGLNAVLTGTGIDGFYTDAVFSGHCYCKYCREKFREETGIVLPEMTAPGFWGNLENAEWRAWIEWRKKSMGDFLVFLQDILKDIDAEKSIFSYYAGAGASNTPSQEAGMSLEDFARGSDFIGYELCNRSPFYSWQIETFNIKSMSAAGEHFRIPVMTLPYSSSPSEAFFAWAMCLANGSLVWANYLEQPGRCFIWQGEHEEVFNYGKVGPFTDIAVLYSSRTRDLYKGRVLNTEAYLSEIAGWCEAITERGIPYTLIIDPDVNKEKLREFKLLVLPNVACLSSGQTDAIREFVRNGGKLIATYETSLYDERGKKRDEFALADLFPPPSRLEDKSKSAEVIKKDFGKGQIIYLSGKPGREYVHWGITSHSQRQSPAVWSDRRSRDFYNLMTGLVMTASPEPAFELLNFPKGILFNVFREREKKKIIYLHLLNAVGALPSEGTEIPLKFNVTYPHIAPPEGKDLSIVIRGYKIERSYMISPDFEGDIELSHGENGPQSSIITIPFLKRYEVICLVTK